MQTTNAPTTWADAVAYGQAMADEVPAFLMEGLTAQAVASMALRSVRRAGLPEPMALGVFYGSLTHAAERGFPDPVGDAAVGMNPQEAAEARANRQAAMNAMQEHNH